MDKKERKWCDSCGEMTDWIDGECTNYSMPISAKPIPNDSKESLRKEFEKFENHKFILWSSNAEKNGETIFNLTNDEIVNFFWNVIQGHRNAIDDIRISYDSQITELQNIIASQNLVINNREKELDGAVSKCLELQKEVEDCKKFMIEGADEITRLRKLAGIDRND